MANQNILTYNSSVVEVELDYFAPTTILQESGFPVGTVFAFLGKVTPWTDDSNPPAPTQDQQYIKSVYNNMFFVKQVNSNDSSAVIVRNDWTANTVYDYYQDNVDMFQKDLDGFPVLSFYVRNRYDQVFKCLWNVSNISNPNGSPSTVEPFFQPGTYGADGIFQGSDNYKWKYMFTVASGDKVKFMDSQWIPVPVGAYTPNPIQANQGTGNVVGVGDIEVINVINGGSGYLQSNTTISIVGDGFGAVAIPKIINGSIVDVEITNPGSNYTYFTPVINSLSGSGAVLTNDVSPIGGHGFDNVSELGCNNIMYSVEFNGNEGGLLPTDIQYTQVGLIVNPIDKNTAPWPANLTSYNTTTQITVAPGVSNYQSGETVYQVIPNTNTTAYQGIVVSFNPISNVLQLINISGTPIYNASIYGNTSNNRRTLLSISTSNFVTFSGYLSYIENRSAVQRSSDGIEQFKFVLGY